LERYFSSKSVPRPFPNAAVALGNFDGVHIGHKYIISKTIELAKKTGGVSVVYTFDPHPVKILAPESCPLLIQTISQRLAALEDLKVDVSIVENFTHEFAAQTPEQFFEQILIKRLGAKAIVVGYDFTFGYHRGGTIEVLEELGKRHNVEVLVVEAKFVGDLLLSSTEIRHFVSTGNVEEAEQMLGRPFRIEGKVVAGKGLGAYLGAHTANIEPENELLPGNGVYLSLTYVFERRATSDERRCWPSITSIGHNPTFPGGPFSVETHLIGFEGKLLGEIIAVDFLKKMRDQIAFPSVEKLHGQIIKDVEEARIWHENRTL